MIYNTTPLAGVFTIDLEPRGDARGYFSRVFCKDEFGVQGLETDFVQFNTSFSRVKHTFRGMHYQLGHSAETKVIKVLQGTLLDVVLDLRDGSPTFGKSTKAELSAENRTMMYVPPGCAHGFMTLTENVEMLYFVSARYDPVRERSVRWNDPAFNITLPFAPALISDKDATVRSFDPSWHLNENAQT